MKRLALIVAATAVLGGTTAGTRAPHPYMGLWSGTWHSQNLTGPITFNVGKNGSLEGTFGEADGVSSTPIAGRVRPDGTFMTQGRQQLERRRTGFEGDINFLSVNAAEGVFERRLSDGTFFKGTIEVVRDAN